MDRSRYDRQMLLPEIGPEGQDRLSHAHALLVGCGALGCVIADLLVRAGIGTISLVDRDIVEPTNLQRQSLYAEADADGLTPKAIAAAERLAAINSRVTIEPIVSDVTGATARGLVAGVAPTILLDGTDNFQTRFVLNDCAVESGIPLLYGGVVGMVGTMMAIMPRERPGRPSPCLTCLLGGIPDDAGGTCDTVGVFGPAVYQVASWQAAQALKIAVGAEPQPGLVQHDAWAGSWHVSHLGHDPGCQTCVRREFLHLDAANQGSAELCGQDAVQVVPPDLRTIDLDAVADRLAASGRVDRRRGLIRVTLDEGGDDDRPIRLTVFRDGRAIVKGVRDGTRGRSLYDRYIGG